ncbi:MFS transporter [Cutibacterium sp. WCA-380-WT-3A]|uniref:Putative proline/betaine transporter n=1 Tax=Cutibacterium porci TaxID=2605781 RepID=A0A7K0J455_9ACTN|nr:MFS transporter [Cutibacterium porci]MSS44703.1 MFS transporter [Cutibacterium porci]
MSDGPITATSVDNPTHLVKNQSVVKTLAGTGIGNALEWYDWNVYASFAVFISTQFFDSSDKTSAFLSTMAIFAVGFVARPVGGAFFGWLADKIGRKHSLAFAVIFASVGSLIIALSPTYNQIGAWASVLLVIARLIQGLAHGGELPAAQTYLSEMAPDNRRGLWASAIYITGTAGMILGLLLGVILRDILSDHALETWGWRIPFALGAVLGLIALWIRSSMHETEVFDQDEEITEHHLWRGVLQNWRTGIKVIGMTCGLTVAYYIWSVSTAAVAEKNLGYSTNAAFGASLIGNIVFCLSLPLWGIFSDKFGRKTNMLVALIGVAVLYVPLNEFVRGGNEMWRLVVAISVMLILLGAYLGIAPAAYAELFPTKVRATGFGIPYAIAIALFGGTAPYIMSAWAETPNRFVIYVIILLVISALTVLTLPETKGKDLHHERV